MKERIEATLEILYSGIKKSLLSEDVDYFLSAGVLGKSIFLYEYGSYLDDAEIIDLAGDCFEKSYSILENETYDAGMEFISGYAGLGWCFQYLSNQDFLEYDEDFCRFFDQVLIEQARKTIDKKNYDLFYGLLGYGNYFIQRNHHQSGIVDSELNEIVDIALEMSVKENEGLKWIDYLSDKKSEVINLGMAHGIASVASFLSKVYAINGNKKAGDAANNAIEWLLANKLNDKYTSCFPNWIGDEIDENHARLAWCNGDLGIGYSVYSCGVALQNKQFVEEGLKVLRKTTARRSIDDTGIVDRGFCHGTSGAFYIYNKLINKYGLLEFTDNRDYWLEKTIQDHSDISSFGAWYGMIEGENQFAPEAGLLNGYSGIGLTLLSYLVDRETRGNWDEIFLL